MDPTNSISLETISRYAGTLGVVAMLAYFFYPRAILAVLFSGAMFILGLYFYRLRQTQDQEQNSTLAIAAAMIMFFLGLISLIAHFTLR